MPRFQKYPFFGGMLMGVDTVSTPAGDAGCRIAKRSPVRAYFRAFPVWGDLTPHQVSERSSFQAT